MPALSSLIPSLAFGQMQVIAELARIDALKVS